MAGEQEQPQDNIEKNIDIAIEAQDGKTPAPDAGGEAPQTEAPPQPESAPQEQPKDRTSGTGDRGTQQKPPAKGEEAPKPTHGPKDLKLQDGTIVKSGQERRFFEQREIARQQLVVRDRELNSARQELADAQRELESVRGSVQSLHGLEPQQLALGARIITDLQRDPSGTLKKLLAEAVAQGYNVDDISSGVDMAAVTRLIDSRLPQPNNGSQVSEQEILEDAQQEANAFFADHPDARPHDSLLAKVLRDHPGLTLEDAYYQIRDAFVEKGFDWSLSLEQNVQESAHQANGAGNQQEQPGKLPLPNGGNTGDSEIKSADIVTLASDDMDTGDIVRQAMRESGLNI